MSQIFDFLKEQKMTSVEYLLGVSKPDSNEVFAEKDMCAYCLARNVDGTIEVLLSNTVRNEKEFDNIVDVLSKEFNAKVIRG